LWRDTRSAMTPSSGINTSRASSVGWEKCMRSNGAGRRSECHQQGAEGGKKQTGKQKPQKQLLYVPLLSGIVGPAGPSGFLLYASGVGYRYAHRTPYACLLTVALGSPSRASFYCPLYWSFFSFYGPSFGHGSRPLFLTLF
jgi:hypothetical protein